ncbi:MAG: DUF853 family protein [Sulfuricurvum sp.]|uniref:ATP-binding protein n=1 Tax=Sulfuricurvum sp. TaxID=2025608 RepID=UPI00262617CB|nr:helicase HerA-like domain-containing protein [Sulfuricurvum sp.]MDD5160503.1 DUF853 family protein [Sulfuricurvum sp.]
MKSDVTFLGQVINVNSSSVEVKISDDIPSAAPIVEGKLYRIGQIGTFVKFPLGALTLFGIVSSVSNTASNDQNSENGKKSSRYLSVQLIGEKQGDDDFQKGVGFYPTINDEVHLVTENDLLSIYGNSSEIGLVEIGTHSSSERLPIYLDLDKLILRHSAILGSTGSGKSNTTAHILKSIVNSNQGSRVILIDIHGEYKDAFPTEAKVLRINDTDNPLVLPFWLMNFDELAMFLVGRQPGQESPSDKRLREEITARKYLTADKLPAGKINEEFITADSPIPFSIKELWYDLAREIVATYKKSPLNEQTKENEADIIDEGSVDDLKYPKFVDYSMTTSEPYKSKHELMNIHEKKILSKLKDSRFNFMFSPGIYEDFENYDLDHLLRSWIAHDKPLTILDLSGVPFELIDLTVGVISRFLFDGMYWGRYEEYTGRNRPLLMVYEEAHSYLPNSSENRGVFGYARKAVEKIYKEGRKFGIGSMVVTQRPSEISHTILAQVGTYIALRLTNSADKSTVSSSAPNNMTSLIDLLPSLRIGEAVIVGEAIKVPSRVRIPLVEPRPSSNDPELAKAWSKEFIHDDEQYKQVVTSMRTQKPIQRK